MHCAGPGDINCDPLGFKHRRDTSSSSALAKHNAPLIPAVIARLAVTQGITGQIVRSNAAPGPG